jgi:hypothetical protein
MGSMRKWDTHDAIDMVHINTSDIIGRIGVVKQRKISEVSFFESCSSVRLWVSMFFHTLISHFIIEFENGGKERMGCWDADGFLSFSSVTKEGCLASLI